MFREKYVNPFTDFGFKKLFGSEPNKDLLIDFLNAVVLPADRRIVELSFSNNEHPGQSELDRKAIFDIFCTGSNGERFIVEMQKAKQNYFKDRSLFYATFPIREQAERGEWDFKLSEIFMVGVLDFAFSESGETPNQVRHEVKLRDEKCRVFYDKLAFIYLEMPHFTKTEAELETLHDKWLFVLKNLPKLENRPQKLQERVFQKLFQVAEVAKFNRPELEQYEDSLKVYRDLKNVIDTAESDGKMEGRMEGFAAGRMAEKTETIKKALKRGRLTLEEIAEDSEVDREFVQKIAAEN